MVLPPQAMPPKSAAPKKRAAAPPKAWAQRVCRGRRLEIIDPRLVLYQLNVRGSIIHGSNERDHDIGNLPCRIPGHEAGVVLTLVSVNDGSQAPGPGRVSLWTVDV